jgi:hypothetical protein
LHRHFRSVQPHKPVAEILLQHDNARPYISFKTLEASSELRWTVLPHPPYRPYLAPSDFHLFGALKDATRGTNFGSDDKVIKEVATSTKFKLLQEGDRFSFSCWCKGVEVEVDEDYVQQCGVHLTHLVIL